MRHALATLQCIIVCIATCALTSTEATDEHEGGAPPDFSQSPVDRWLKCVERSVTISELERVKVGEDRKIDTAKHDATPFFLTPEESNGELGLLMKSTTLAELSSMYGSETIKWHFGGGGTQELPPLWKLAFSENFLTLRDAYQNMRAQIQRRGRTQSSEEEEDSAPATFPTFFVTDNTEESCCCEMEFRSAFIHDETPLYAFTSTTGLMVKRFYNEDTKEVEPVKREFSPESGLVERMVEDGIVRSKLPSSLYDVKIVGEDYRAIDEDGSEDLDLYFATAFSGTHFHTHGTAIASSTGRKLWLLLSPAMQCKWAANPDLLAKAAGLPPICDETWPFWGPRNKFHMNASLCNGQLHPLEIAQQLVRLAEHKLAPMVVLQKPGDIIILPERWLHATINLDDDSITVSYRYGRSTPYHLGCEATSERVSEKEKAGSAIRAARADGEDPIEHGEL